MHDPLTLPIPTLSLVSTTKVPNVFPTDSVPYRLAIVGEAPGQDEETHGVPFIGASGRLLDSILSGVGILRSGCFVGNVCQYRPPGNDIKTWGYAHPKVQAGWLELQDELKTYKSNCILALGNTPLYFLCGKSGITSWRGSIMSTDFGKVVPSIHPAAVLREYKQWVLLRFDALRARQEAEKPELSLPQRNLELDLTADEICYRLDNWPAERLLSFDIEGGLEAFPCCSVAGEINRGFIVAWNKFDEYNQGRITCSLSRVLYRDDVPKVLQNSLYDRFVLAYGYNMLIRNVVEDTMLKQWEVYPELPKGLGTIASIWTREPFYKFERKTSDQNDFYRYCIRDSCVTLEASNAMSQALPPNAIRHYRFNLDLLSPLLYMEMRGIRYDQATATEELAQVRAALSETSTRLELRAGYSLCGAKGSVSHTKLKKCLYNEKGYPEQKKGRGASAKVATDIEALLNLSKKFPNDPFISDLLLHSKLESIQETLAITADPDNRVRCGYNLVGTETGRLTCYTSPTGSGANLQTITKKLRKLYLADENHWFFQCDLSGADGWTVAAHCLRHGDSTMWDDYHSSLKPARIIALMYEHGAEATNCSRTELLDRCRSVDDDGWLYFACKRIQHASNYGVQWKTGIAQIATDSYKLTGTPVYIDRPTFESLQRLYFFRYPGVYAWQNWCGQQVESGHNLQSASDHTRTFFGRRKSWNTKLRAYSFDHETWKEWLAQEPQANTTYATNLALYKLWYDTDNRVLVDGRTRLRVEPLQHGHDALAGQFAKAATDWAKSKIREWFNNPIRVAGVEFVIPFTGTYGRSWGELKEGTI
jgi:uracil-DNA glycosylase family 4